MADKPRVLLHAFSTFNLGGPQARFVQLANAFGPAYTHIIAAMDNCFVAAERLSPNVRWEPLHLDVKKGGALANRSYFREVLKDRQPDLLLSYNWGAIEWAAANTPSLLPQVHVEDGFGAEEANGQLQRRVWMRRALLAARHVPMVVASRHLGRIARKQWWMPESSVRFIPNGVALPDTKVVKSADTNQPLVIGTVAGLRPEKNIARLIKAFAAVRTRHDVKLVIIGDGPERSALENLASRLEVCQDVEFAGYLAKPDERLQHFDLFALSSDTEQLPMSLLEAMAFGIPVIATRVGDVEQILANIGVESIVEPNDVAFAQALLKMIELRSAWPDMIAAGYQEVSRNYSLNIMQKAWSNIFDGNFQKLTNLVKAGR